LYIAGKEGPRARPLKGSQEVVCSDDAVLVTTVVVVGACGYVQELVWNGDGIPYSWNDGR